MVKISFLRFRTQIAQIEMICCFKLVQKLSLALNTNCVSHIGIILAILMKRLILTRNYFMLLTICSATLLFPQQAMWQEGTSAICKNAFFLLLQPHWWVFPCSMSKRLQLEPSTPSTAISPVQTPSSLWQGGITPSIFMCSCLLSLLQLVDMPLYLFCSRKRML